MKRTINWYIGHRSDGTLEAFQHFQDPTHSDGLLYGAVVGPFRTKRGAKWAERFGAFNPHFTDVDAAERLARLEAQRTRRAIGEASPDALEVM